MSGWHLIFLPFMSVWTALLEADSVLYGQWMLSRPILIGPLVGLAAGGLEVGLALGALFELLSFDSEPVGSAMPMNAAVAASSSVLIAAGPDLVPLAAAFPAGAGLGFLHRALEIRIRQRRGALTLSAGRDLQSGGRVAWEPLLAAAAWPQLLATTLVVWLGVAVLSPLALAAWIVLPRFIHAALQFAFDAALWIALACLLRALGRRK